MSFKSKRTDEIKTSCEIVSLVSFAATAGHAVNPTNAAAEYFITAETNTAKEKIATPL